MAGMSEMDLLALLLQQQGTENNFTQQGLNTDRYGTTQGLSAYEQLMLAREGMSNDRAIAAMDANANSGPRISQNLADPAELALERAIAQMQAGTSRDVANINAGGGRDVANINAGASRYSTDAEAAVNRERINLDKMLGERVNAINAANLFSQRATRQLNAPGGKLIPSLAPILGRATI